MILDNEQRRKLAKQLMRHEGTKRDAGGRHVAYRCPAGALTIGYGHNLDANPRPGMSGASRLSDEEAEGLLLDDIAATEKALAARLPLLYAISPARRAVLLNMAFNLGPAGLLSFKNTLCAVERGDYREASKRMLQSKWAGQVKGRALELAGLMESGTWPDESPKTKERS